MLLCGDNDLRMFARSYDHIPDLQAVTGPKIDLIGNISEAVRFPLFSHGLSVGIRRYINSGLPIARSHKTAAGVIRVTGAQAGRVVISMTIIITYLFRFSRSFFGDRQSNHALSH